MYRGPEHRTLKEQMMEKSIYKFIWKYSKRDQCILVFVTLLTFPVLYVSLELPKRIINEGINGTDNPIVLLGKTLSQVEFLMVLCAGFLLTVVLSGFLKMRLNTMKGVLTERLLRRFRYQLLTRMMRFARPYFRNTSQGELVSMVTSEAEQMGGIMGDMLSQPVLQTGQMITILAFLFIQSFWFGLAAIALIPLQAWIIPILQRQINQLNKLRIQEVRKLAADIGETAAGVSDIRSNGGSRYRMSLFSNRLGNLYDTGYEIYQKKFFMKFLNNFINQLTPFFFYSVGGYLVITGHITVGALVAALAAFKDMTAPWKELLEYYSITQDMALRWETVTERFASDLLVDDSLFDGEPDADATLKGDIKIKDVSVRDEDDHTVLEDISLTIPQGARVAIKAENETEAMAFADLLIREVLPNRGSVTIAGQNLNTVHQVTLANRIGYVHSNPHILRGTIGDNILLPLKNKPIEDKHKHTNIVSFQEKARQSGNSVDLYDTDWIDPAIAGFKSSDEVRDWWFQLVGAIGMHDFIVRRAMRSTLELSKHQKVADEIVRLRPEIARRLADAELNDIVHIFHPDKFNPVSPLGSNLLYALPTGTLTQVSLSQDKNFVPLLREQGIADELMRMSVTLIESLTATFGDDGTNHPLFRRLNLDEELYLRLGSILNKRRAVGDDRLLDEDYALMLTVPFAFSAEQIGPAFSDAFKERVLQIRKTTANEMVQALNGLFETIDPKKYISVMTVMGNALFGRISIMAGAREKTVEDVVIDVLSEHGLRRLLAESIYDVATSSGGSNIPAVLRERISFSRAAIKRPDILILRNSLASHESKARDLMRENICTLMPDATKIFIEPKFMVPENYDLYVEIVNGRIDNGARQEVLQDMDARQDLNRKIKELASTNIFGGLDRKQQRLLAFGAQWYEAKAGTTIFSLNDEADAAYLCINGLAGLYWPTEAGEHRLVSDVPPGRLIGDLSIIVNQRRRFDFAAIDDCLFLRIGATELMAVIEHDAVVASSLMRVVAENLWGNIEKIRTMRSYSIERGVDFSEYDVGLKKI